ncbi:synaptobrevin synaptobrevin [Cryptosporidium sp. chipmunk genotype I]|uniref:synaptobrevin synaptobrevin n=1 Tax=Cryptosporidium sp. chipmunk genotype I TaxID=1280935 RepID=UPI00351A65C2|nr:synaptobrevin synaptobrevin [Cryptosporidium sp. chipmunk genotype I]
MSTQTNEVDQEAQQCNVYKELEEFEKKLAAARKRTRDADYLDRKLVISDSTEFERHFDNLSEAIARLLPYHTFYVDEIKSNRVLEEPSKILERKKRIKSIEDSILSVSTSSPSFIFNACKYGFVRVIHSSMLMDLERNKKELAQLQALELTWKYPMENSSNFPNEKGMISSSSVLPVSTLNSSNHLSTTHFDNSNDLLYRNVMSKNQANTQLPNMIGNYNMNKHYFDTNDILGREKDKDLFLNTVPSSNHVSHSPNLDSTHLPKISGSANKSVDLYSLPPDMLKSERFSNISNN